MHISASLAVFGAAMLSAPAFAAPVSIVPDAGSSAMVSVQTIPGAQHTLRANEAAGVVGRYDLSDGEILRVSFEHRKLFAEIGDLKTELVPAGPNTFVARADNRRFVFSEQPFANDVSVRRQ